MEDLCDVRGKWKGNKSNPKSKQIFGLYQAAIKLSDLNQDLHALGIQNFAPNLVESDLSRLQSIILGYRSFLIEQVSNELYKQYHSPICSIEMILERQTTVTDKRKKLVETHKFLTAFAILLSQKTSLSLTDSVNHELNKYYQKPLAKKMILNYVRLIRLDATTVDGQHSLIRLLGPLFPIHLLN